MLSPDDMPTERPSKRRRRGGATPQSERCCPHCGRTFKRAEHLERHVRTHTKEKPFICHCGAAFTRRDLLTRHQRITLHEEAPEQPDPRDASLYDRQNRVDPEADAAVAAAASLSGMSMNPWVHQHQHQHRPPPQADVYHATAVHAGGEPPHGIIDPAFPPPLLGQEIYDNGQDITGFDHFREFANFLDGVGLPAEWSPYFHGPEPPNDLVDPALQEPGSRAQTATPVARNNPGRPGTPFSCWLPSAPEESSSRIAEIPRSLEAQEPPPFRVTEDQRSRLAACLGSFRDVVDAGFQLPSRHALTRYLTSYFQGFHLHMPFIHPHTWRVLDTPLELVLAVATVGAQYSFEHRVSERLFRAGKAILLKRLTCETAKFGPKTMTFLSLHNLSSMAGSVRDGRDLVDRTERDWGPWEPMDTIRALVVLMAYATWERKEEFVAEAFLLQSLLVQALRDIGLEEEPRQEDPNSNAPNATAAAPEQQQQHPPPGSSSLKDAWLAWVRQESVRRSKLIAFTFLHTHSVAYHVYPVLRSNEIRLRLPCPTGEWQAPTAAQWQRQRQSRSKRKEQLNFQDALSLLLRQRGSGSGAAPLDPIPTPLGNYVLLHGLLQRIHIVRDLSLPIMDQSASLPTEEVNKLERGLRSWTSGWQQAPESSLDPNNENGPIPFTSSSLLGLAYARIYLNLGPYRLLETRDPGRIARALGRCPAVERGDGVISALLYAAHALSVPVRLGVDRVARSQAFFWSVRHALSGLECAVLLSKWLHSLGDSVDNARPLSDSEDRILHWVRCIVEEAWAVVDFDEVEPAAAIRGDPASLGLAVLKIWAHFFKSNTQWPFINIIGLSLEKYREILLRGAEPRPAT
ncbi:hypothetical protein SLS62_006547 [Diatrype stigma]|uniref:C2H2-type domain-containing protein n=1 Tax=Diatrype stigma TaxID=117547 RepID=A0AAN9UQG9_9PEZI